MQICGFQKTTLLDYPEHVAATIFLGGCNFRCPFCYNSDLVLHPDACMQETEGNVLSFLAKRKGILQGVCVTGGEPTLSPALPSFLRSIKELGYPVKLDTNGSNPSMLQALYDENLIDYVAMDIKSGISDYLSVCGLSSDSLCADNHSDRVDATCSLQLSGSAAETTLIKNIKKSIHFLIHETDASHFQYEFRTTVVKPLHTAASFLEIANLIDGADRYFLQSYQNTDAILALAAASKAPNTASSRPASPDFVSFGAYTREELESFAEIVRPHVGHIALRGIE